MKAKYLSRNSACALAADHQHLVGQQFDVAHNVQMVVVAPYSRILQWAHVSSLLRSKPAPPNPSNRYDALVIALAPDTPAGFLIQDVRSFVEEAGDHLSFSHARELIPVAAARR